MIEYEITKTSPQQLFMQVRYHEEGSPDYWANFSVDDFSEENLHSVASSGASDARNFWDRIEALPEEVSINTQGVAKERIYVSEPIYNLDTEVIEQVVTETDETIMYEWAVRDKTSEELAEDISRWRSTASVTPRQARLALASRGQLSGIDTIIAALSVEQQEVVQIEWEYAVSVERRSPWVVQLGAALGLDEQGLDELFTEAEGL